MFWLVYSNSSIFSGKIFWLDTRISRFLGHFFNVNNIKLSYQKKQKMWNITIRMISLSTYVFLLEMDSTPFSRFFGWNTCRETKNDLNHITVSTKPIPALSKPFMKSCLYTFHFAITSIDKTSKLDFCLQLSIKITSNQ